MATLLIKTTSTPTALTHSLRDYMKELSNKISERAYCIFEKNGSSGGHSLEDWLKAESEFLTPVRVDISETNSELILKAAVPGFSEKNLEVVAEPDHLFITGKVETQNQEKKNKKVIYSESVASEVFRSVNLPVPIDSEKVTAVLQDGVLEITMQKAAPAKPKPLAVQAKAA